MLLLHYSDLCTGRVNCLNAALLFVQGSWTEAVECAVSSASEEETVVDTSLSLCVCGLSLSTTISFLLTLRFFHSLFSCFCTDVLMYNMK